MVLNPALYRVLIKHFGDVKIYNEDQPRVEERLPGERIPAVHERGESYNVDCPICGDQKQRLSISYKWLTRNPLTRKLQTNLVHCYNEDCPAHREEFYGQFLDDLRAAEMGLLDDIEVRPKQARSKKQRGAIPLPRGCKPLHELPDDHPAVQFLLKQYRGFRTIKFVHYLSTAYGAMFTDTYDRMFPPAQDRVIFPVYSDGRQVAWQGRTIEDDALPRWYLPPGFVKVFYNADRVPPFTTPILTEGITNAICCGPNGIAMFGKQLNTLRAKELASRYSSVVIATDPDTFVPDHRKGGNGRVFAQELRELLEKHMNHVYMLRWPEEILELARQHSNGEDVKVPDAADLGLRRMRQIIRDTLGENQDVTGDH